jgi:phage terminase large subunit-like protein
VSDGEAFDPRLADLMQKVQNWPAADRERALEEYRRRTEQEAYSWYCNRRPTRMRGLDGKVFNTGGCDGRPHEGYPFEHARGDQWPPPGADWFLWFLMAGRGFGKTRSGSEYTRNVTKRVEFMALIGATSRDVRETMIEGESGLVRVFERFGESIHYEPSKSRITFPNGCRANLFSAEEPDRLRGPQHEFAWGDEPAHWDDPQAVWDQLMFGMRLGKRPHVLFTSTPLPSKFVRERAADKTTVVAKGSTFANLANLAPTFRQQIVDRYEGTRLGRQELNGEILGDVEGAMWTESLIRRIEWTPEQAKANCDRIVVFIDPAGTANKRSDETGIVVAGRRGREGFVLSDSSGKYSPNGWARKAIDEYRRWSADAIGAEKNFGGDMVRTTIEQELKEAKQEARIKVTTASRSKELRAEPIVGLYEQGRILHIGKFTELEEEMLTWIPMKSKSPNRIDAMVHGFTDLFEGIGEATVSKPPLQQRMPARSAGMRGAAVSARRLGAGLARRIG